MLSKLTDIIVYMLLAFGLSMGIYPVVIKQLRKWKLGITNRELASTGEKAVIFNELHKKKNWTPTMWGVVFLIVMALLVGFSFLLQKMWYINNTLVSRQETYILLVSFFGVGLLGLIDDYIKLKLDTKINWLGATLKLVYMILFAVFISYRFNMKLGINTINLRPIDYIRNAGSQSIHLFGYDIQFSFWYILVTFFLTTSIINAINITDWLDGLMGGMILIILVVLWGMSFYLGWYLATTIIGIVIGILLGYLWFNISPAKIFMGDSGSLALGGLVSALVYLIAIKIWFIIPFIILFALFWIEVGSSFLQIFWKKTFKKKLFLIAPLHHLLEKLWYPEANIVMRFWLIQGALAMVVVIMLIYQISH